MTDRQPEAHEALRKQVDHAYQRFFARMWGSPSTWAVCDGDLEWNAEPIQKDLGDMEARQIAREMNLAAILSLIAKRLSDVTEEMREAGRHANAMTPDNALGLEYAPFELAYLAMLQASAIFSGRRT